MIWWIGEFALLFKYTCLQMDISINEIQFLLPLELSLRTVIMMMMEIFSLQWLVSPRYFNCLHDSKQLQHWSQWSPQDIWEYRHSCSFSSPLPEGFFLHMFLFTYTAAEHCNRLVEEGGVGTHRFMRNMETACSISDQSEDSTDATHPSPHLAC